jgi:hypothetical protein
VKHKRRGRYISYWWTVWEYSTWENKEAFETYLGSCLVRLFVINSVKRVRPTVLSRFVDCLFDVINEISGPGSSVRIATGYGLDGPRIESRWE